MSQTLYDWCQEHPEKLYLLDEWDVEPNKGLTPRDVSAKSHSKYFWKCPKGHSYMGDPSHKTRFAESTTTSTGCPYCQNRKILIGFNDLASQYPEIAKDWHPTKNGELTSEMVTGGSNKKVWWQDEFGREWQAQVNCRTAGSKYTYGSLRNSFFEGTVYYYLMKSFPDVQHGVRPEWMERQSELDFFIPALNLAIEIDGWPWHNCPERDEKKNKECEEHGITLIRLRDTRCPSLRGQAIIIPCAITMVKDEIMKAVGTLFAYLSKVYQTHTPVINVEADNEAIQKLIQEEEYSKSLEVRFPDIAGDWDYEKNGRLTPSLVAAKSDRLFWWKCKVCGNSWQATAANRTGAAKSGCPFCGKKQVMVGKTDLATVNPALAKFWHPTKNKLRPQDVFPNAHLKVWWRCEKGHEWEAYIIHENRKRVPGCPGCKKTKTFEGVNDLATTDPGAAVFFDNDKNDGLTAKTVGRGRGKKVWLKCPSCGHEWQQILHNLVRNPHCLACGWRHDKIDG